MQAGQSSARMPFHSSRPILAFSAEAAADDDVVALDRVAVVADRDLRADQADVADVVLGAGMMAAGQVDVDRRVEREPAAST